MSNFALIGAAGYIAPRHLQALKETKQDLLVALDPFDSVGILDRYYPNADFFTEFERFDRHLDKLKRKGQKIDYVSVCTPNYLHDAHVRFGLRHDAHVICEKPIVLNPWNLESLIEFERETGKNVYNILQLRLHPSVQALKEKIEKSPKDKVFDIDLTYLTSRGNWYYTSWKGDVSKSGGIATNIGVHFFDMLSWIFGDLKRNDVHIHEHDRAAGYLEFSRAKVRWFLSINSSCIPQQIAKEGLTTYRSLKIEQEEFEFSGGFTDLHTTSYKNILEGEGFRISEAQKAIQIVHEIRNMKPLGLVGDYHPMAALDLSKHPFLK